MNENKNINNNKQNPQRPQGRPPMKQPSRSWYWIYVAVLTAIFAISIFGSKEQIIPTHWNAVEQMIGSGSVEKIVVVNKDVAEVHLTKEAVEELRSHEEYKYLPRTGAQYSFHIGSVDTFREDLDKAQEARGEISSI